MTRWKRGVELLAGIAIGLGFFLAMLGLLNFVFPDATGMGLLVRGDGVDSSGRSLVLEGPDTAEIVAQLWDVQGSVKDRSSRSVVWGQAQEGIGLEDRHAVQSRRGASASIAFNATNKLELDENTLVVVRRPNRLAPNRAAHASVLFVEGSIRGKLGGSDSGPMDVEILTAGGSIHARGDGSSPADFRLSSTTSGKSTLSMHSGSADVRGGGTTTKVNADQALTMHADGTVGIPVRLPGKPKLRTPARGAKFVYRSAPPQIAFAWSPVATAERYRVEIARNASFDDVVYDGVVNESGIAHGNLRQGSYFWRARAQAGDAESRPSRTGKFRVIQDREAPALSVQLPDGPVRSGPTTLAGRAEPGCRILVGDRSVTADESGEFAMNLDLRDGYNILVVQAIDPAGNTAFVTREFQAGATKPESSL